MKVHDTFHFFCKCLGFKRSSIDSKTIPIVFSTLRSLMSLFDCSTPPPESLRPPASSKCEAFGSDLGLVARDETFGAKGLCHLDLVGCIVVS